MRAVAAYLAAIALAFAPAPAFSAPSAFPSPASAGPANYLGMWEAESGKARFELRADSEGRYEAIVAWAADDAAPQMRRKVGGALIRGLRWDERAGRFVGGLALAADSDAEYACELRPGKAESLELRVSVGFVSKSTTWRRPRGS